MKKKLLVFVFAILNTISFSQNFQWVRTYGCSLGTASSNAVTTDASGNIYVTGNYSGTVDFDNGPGVFNLTSTYLSANPSIDIFILKLDASGNFLWAKSIGGINDDQGFGIAVDPSGNVLTTGYFRVSADFDPGAGVYTLTSTTGIDDVFILKLDPSGNFVWAKSIDGTPKKQGFAIDVDTFGNVFTTGTYGSGTVDFDPGATTYTMTSLASGSNNSSFILKLDASGNFVWAKSFGGSFSFNIYALKVDLIGNVVTTGSFISTEDFDPSIATYTITPGASGGGNGFILKLDATGNFVWAKNCGGGYNQQGDYLALDASGDVYTTGTFGTTNDFDPGAGTYTLSPKSVDIFVSKLDATGNFVWAKSMGGIYGYSYGFAIDVDVNNNVYTSGKFSSPTDFDPAPTSTFTLATSANGTDGIFNLKLDPSGNFIWASAIAPDANASVKALTIDGSGNYYTVGRFNNTVDFDSGSGTYSLSALGSNDAFIMKLNSTSVTGIDKMQLNDFYVSAYPNPNNGHFTIDLNTESQIYITNTLGQNIYNENHTAGQNKIDLQGIDAGVYFIIIKNNGLEKALKMIKE